MPKRLDATTCHARAEALEECITHLDQPWTAHESTNGPEWQAGKWLQKQLQAEALRYRERAHACARRHPSAIFR